MAIPAWLAATASNPTKAGQVNQFLGTHASTLLYTGALQASQSTAGSGAVNSNGLYIAQSFTTGSSQTAIGRIAPTLAATGTPNPISVSIQANSSGSPSGTPLVTTLLPHDYFTSTPGVLSIPVPVTGLTASTTYWIVLNAVGDASDFFSWSKSNQTAGAKTSTNGTSWTSQTYGLLYFVFDQTPVGQLIHTWEDAGARWTQFFYNTNGSISAYGEFTQGQATGSYVYSGRGLTYTKGLLTGVS